MLYREIIAVCSQILTTHLKTVCGQNVEFLRVKTGGIQNNLLGCKGLNSAQGEGEGSASWPNRFGSPCPLHGEWMDS
jgi:hypothetical protein